MNSIKENTKQNILIEDSFNSAKNTNQYKYFQQNQIKSLSFNVEKFAIIPNTKSELNNEKIITSSNLPLENQWQQNKENLNSLFYNPTLNTKIDLNTENSLEAKSPNSGNLENIADFNQENNLTNFSNFKTNKIYVVKDSDLTAAEMQNQAAIKPKNTNNARLRCEEDASVNKAEKVEKTELSIIEKDLFFGLKKFPERKNEYLQSLIRTYNINFSNNIIDLSHKNLGTAQIELISIYLKKDSEKFQCEEFKICNQRLSANAMQDISGFIKHCRSLKYLDLSGCEIGDLGCRHFCEAFESQKTLSEINLQKNSIGEVGAESLSDILVNNDNISKLELEHNFIGNKGAAKLYEAIRINMKVKWLNLFGNISISQNFIAKISTQLKNNRISTRGRKPLKQYSDS